MNSDSEFQKYVNEKSKLYEMLMNFLENSYVDEKDYDLLIDTINQRKYTENREEFEHFLYLLINISNNHCRDKEFINKIEQILQNYLNTIKQTFSNSEIFSLFKSSKKILLILFKKEIIKVDEFIFIELKSDKKFHFFYPEIKAFKYDEDIKNFEKEFINNSNILDFYERNREIGENDSYICSLIRNDSVVEFITFVNQTNYPLESEIKYSIFETNRFLINKNPSLIEYTAFFGSIQIFNYLKMNEVELKPSLWHYAIHSNCAELIHILEENKIDPPNGRYEECLAESIKCHHNNIARHIQDNLINQNKESKMNIEVIKSIYHYHNYSFFTPKIKESSEFFYLCFYNYFTLVDIYLRAGEKKFQIDDIYLLLSKKTEIEDSFFADNGCLDMIAIPPTIRSIGCKSFSRCSNLTNISIPSSVTEIGEFAFF